MADTKPPACTQSLPAESLSQNTLWLSDELFSKNVYATAERDRKDDRHVYVNGLSDPAVGGRTVGLYASARVCGRTGVPQTGPAARARVSEDGPQTAQSRDAGEVEWVTNQWSNRNIGQIVIQTVRTMRFRI